MHKNAENDDCKIASFQISDAVNVDAANSQLIDVASVLTGQECALLCVHKPTCNVVHVSTDTDGAIKCELYFTAAPRACSVDKPHIAITATIRNTTAFSCLKCEDVEGLSTCSFVSFTVVPTALSGATNVGKIQVTSVHECVTKCLSLTGCDTVLMSPEGSCDMLKSPNTDACTAVNGTTRFVAAEQNATRPEATFECVKCGW